MPADPIWITEEEVVALVDLADAIDAVETGFRSQAAGTATAMTKTHASWGDGHTLHAIGAVDEVLDLAAAKSWAHSSRGATPLLVLWDAATGGIRAIVEAFALGQLRTGAVSGVATRWIAAPDASRLAVIGSGRQALPQAAAVLAVRPIVDVRVYSPTAAHRDALVAQLRELAPQCAIDASSSVAEAVASAAVITTVTRAREPFLAASMVGPATHVNAVGAITPERRELRAELVAAARLVAADDVGAARRLAAELADVDRLIGLGDVVAGTSRSDRGEAPTIFKAMGTGLADLAVGALVLERAAAAGLGRPVPFSGVRANPRLHTRTRTAP